MHEFSIMQSTLETAAQKTRAAEATQIHRLKVRVGKLSGVVPEALRFRRGTGNRRSARRLLVRRLRGGI